MTVVKQHPALIEGEVFDTSVEELTALKGVKDLVKVEMRAPNGTSTTLVCTKVEFAKVVPDAKLDGFDNSPRPAHRVPARQRQLTAPPVGVWMRNRTRNLRTRCKRPLPYPYGVAGTSSMSLRAT